MKEVIIVAGENKLEAAWLRHCLSDEGYNSILGETVEEIIEELGTLRSCEVSVLLAVIAPTILKNISDDVINRLSKCITASCAYWLSDAELLFHFKYGRFRLVSNCDKSSYYRI